MADDLARDCDRAACRAAIKVGSKSFYAASLLLPLHVREPAYALYAFCRLADDAVDLSQGKREALARLRDRLDRAYRGDPWDDPADRCFAAMVRRHGLPRALPEALIEGLAWDAEGRRYETLSDVRAYGARVAAAVGAMMTVLMGVRSPEALARACDLGVAMQLSNIARDVGEDAREGRLFLPLERLRAADIDPDAFLADPRFTPALGGVVEELLVEAEYLYDRAASGIRRLPFGVRPAIRAARLLYREIGREVARRGFDSVASRAVVPAGVKRRLMARALSSVGDPIIGRGQPPLPETRFLVEAVAHAPWPRQFVRPTVGDHIGRMAEILMDAHARQSGRPMEPARIAGE
ncbi:MAG: phytoene/squalene synthase family protein [Rhodobacteraceae bacterium]|nr:MAG: phytoene/squalene synthase family protein [Paracoccaceae bacterium]